VHDAKSAKTSEVRIPVSLALITSSLIFVSATPSVASENLLRVNAAPTMQVVATIAVGTMPWGVAFSPDGMVAYVGNSGSNTISVIDVAARTSTTVSGGRLIGSAVAGVVVTPDGTKALFTPFNYPETFGLNTSDLQLSNVPMTTSCVNPLPITMRDDGTAAYVGCGDGRIQAIDTTTLVSTLVRAQSGDVRDVAYVPQGSNSGDDIAYVRNEILGTQAGYFQLSNANTSTVLPGYGYSVAVDDSGVHAYVGDSTGTLSIFSIATPTVADDTFLVGGDPKDIALTSDGRFAFITDSANNSVKLADLTGLEVVDQISVGSSPQSIALSPDERTALVTNNAGNTVSVIAITAAPPPAPPTPTPAPVVAPSAPQSIRATAADASAVISWNAPSSDGSYPISTYQAVVSPGGHTCLIPAPALQCAITGLTDGTTYTATVRALNGAGWGPTSTASAPFTPHRTASPSITITGTRTEIRGRPGVRIAGVTTNIDMGAVLRPWVRFPGQRSYTEEAARVFVDENGTFTWQRRTGKRVYVSMRSEDGSMASNRVIIKTN
jgi:YVTN family beta-propeller protein